jgi:hypothetical protein
VGEIPRGSDHFRVNAIKVIQRIELNSQGKFSTAAINPSNQVSPQGKLSITKSYPQNFLIAHTFQRFHSLLIA